MAEINIAAIKRSGTYSPNHVANDASILNLVAVQLRKRGCSVTLYTEDDLIEGRVPQHLIINMCRERRSLDILTARQSQGDTVINSPQGITNCMRGRMPLMSRAASVPFPPSIVTDTNRAIVTELQAKGINKCWVKRADDYPRHKEDVTFVRSAAEAQEVLQEYFLRGIPRAVISKHIKGEIIKFYGVAGTRFFHWEFPYDAEHPNATGAQAQAIEKKLMAMCESLAREIALDIYGGDAVLHDDGTITIIDFNDWPSFAPCRDKASVAIAKHVLATFKQQLQQQ